MADLKGLKRICMSCGARFYDLNKKPIICPSCKTEFTGEIKVKARRGRIANDIEDAEVDEPIIADGIGAAADDTEEVEQDEEVVSLEDIEEDKDVDDDEIGLEEDLEIEEDLEDLEDEIDEDIAEDEEK